MTYANVHLAQVDTDKSRLVGEGSSQFRFHVKLCPPPPEGWDLMFDFIHQTSRHGRWHQAHCIDGCIVICCTLRDLRQFLLEDLSLSVARTNHRYGMMLDQRRGIGSTGA